jgi:hypothetical protein
MTYDQAIKLMRILADTAEVQTIIQPITSQVKNEKISFDAAEPAIHIEINIPRV